MEALKAVLKDLYAFAVQELLGKPNLHLATKSTSVDRAIQIRPTISLAAPLSTPISTTPTSGNPTLLTVAVFEAPLFSSPVAAFDSVIMLLPFGRSLTYRQRQNRWLEVETGGIRGWILTDNVTEEHVMPQFMPGVLYDANHEVTKKVRAFIQNEFYGTELHSPLQDVEYVSYRLRRKGKIIPWGIERPRTPGAWQRLLRGKSGVHIGVTPKTDTVMEIINDDETGHVAYVDAVFPNQSILISEIGVPETGHFLGRTLEKEAWVELKPIFIDVA